ncbi:hypothetical protein ADICYQ_5439 [Cyclobacterium qasimii M12-11B]|uniref:Uncharacterized protein n=1 Tax=Cyclobacterium qasimii M12-11B TaxID=641524 RepID=S7WMU4_9BACT|nr:hypothetical protein ADICYQ_5439 [Cyclobacterium qasimii M12-11B]
MVVYSEEKSQLAHPWVLKYGYPKGIACILNINQNCVCTQKF